MSVSAISNPQAYQPNPQQQTFRQDFQALTSALQTGDLSSAQSAYSTLLQDNPQLANAANGSGNPMQQALASIGSSLQSGDVKGAQDALSSFQQNMKAHHGHHHHGGGAHGAASADLTTTTSTTSPLSATSTSLNFLA